MYMPALICNSNTILIIHFINDITMIKLITNDFYVRFHIFYTVRFNQ